MAQQHDDTRAHARKDYRNAREAFDDLRFEDQALFLVEAAVSTVVRGVEQLSRAFARGLDDVMHEAEQAKRDDPDRGHDEADRPSEETAQATPPTTPAKKTTAKKPAEKKPPEKKTAKKKPASKKSTTKKKSTKRSAKKKASDEDQGDMPS